MKVQYLLVKEDIKKVINQGRVEGNLYYLPDIQLDRKTYVEVNKVLTNYGGKWNKGSKAHVFDDKVQFEEIFSELNHNKVVDKKKTFQFFETPDEIVDLMLAELGVRELDSVLEPSAGLGAIVKRLNVKNITMVEIDPIKCEALEQFPYRLVCEDFLKFNVDGVERFDKIIMNPPFTQAQDVKHVVHAFNTCLKPGGRLASIMSKAVTFNSREVYQNFRGLVEENGYIINLDEKSFSDSGTNVNTVLVVLNKPI